MPLLTPNPLFSATCYGLREQGRDWHMLSGIFAFPFRLGRKEMVQERVGGEASEERVPASKSPAKAEPDQDHLHSMAGCCLKKMGCDLAGQGHQQSYDARGPLKPATSQREE